MFDTFIGEYRCIKCGMLNQFKEQTIDFDCILAEFYLGDYVEKGNINSFYEINVECPQCHKMQMLSLAIRRGQYVGVYQKEDADKMDILDLDNIEEGYQRRLDRERECREKIGFEVETLHDKYEEKHVGDFIRALGTDWRVCRVFKRIAESRHDKGTYIYLVTDDIDIRVIGESINLLNQICRTISRIDCNTLDECADDVVFAYAKEHYIEELVRIE